MTKAEARVIECIDAQPLEAPSMPGCWPRPG